MSSAVARAGLRPRRAARATGRRLIFLCPDIEQPTGGIQVIYRHVDLLNAAGFDAIVVHGKPGFRCTWFENSTRVGHLGSTRITPQGSVLVLPEILAEHAGRTPGLPTVIFSQNAYYTFNSSPAGRQAAESPYHHPDVRAVVVVSQDNEAYVRYAFPGQRVERVYNSVDAELFHPDPDKAWRLAYMPRKNAHDSKQVISLLNARGVLDGIEVLALEGLPRAEVARALRQTLIFLAFGHPEGFGLPPAEAMACACVTVGYHGMGGTEFLRPPYAHPVPFGDVVGYARTVEALILELREAPERLLDQAERAAAFVASEYSAERERESVVALWDSLLSDLD